MDDLEAESHEKRLAKGIPMLEDGRFEGAGEFLSGPSSDLQKRAVPELQSLIDE